MLSVCAAEGDAPRTPLRYEVLYNTQCGYHSLLPIDGKRYAAGLSPAEAASYGTRQEIFKKLCMVGFFILIERGNNQTGGLCGILMAASYPTV